MTDAHTYRITYSNGAADLNCDTYAEAVAVLRKEWPAAAIGHDGDIESGGERTLCWATEADSIDDDGARAVASIWAVLDV